MKTFSIGRDLGCDVVINDTTDVVSRRHAVVCPVTPTGLGCGVGFFSGRGSIAFHHLPIIRRHSVTSRRAAGNPVGVMDDRQAVEHGATPADIKTKPDRETEIRTMGIIRRKTNKHNKI